MLAITPQMRILVAVEAVDFRKGIDSLAELCRAKLNADPFSGCLFVFRSRRATSSTSASLSMTHGPAIRKNGRSAPTSNEVNLMPSRAPAAAMRGTRAPPG